MHEIDQQMNNKQSNQQMFPIRTPMKNNNHRNRNRNEKNMNIDNDKIQDFHQFISEKNLNISNFSPILQQRSTHLSTNEKNERQIIHQLQKGFYSNKNINKIKSNDISNAIIPQPSNSPIFDHIRHTFQRTSVSNSTSNSNSPPSKLLKNRKKSKKRRKHNTRKVHQKMQNQRKHPILITQNIIKTHGSNNKQLQSMIDGRTDEHSNSFLHSQEQISNHTSVSTDILPIIELRAVLPRQAIEFRAPIPIKEIRSTQFNIKNISKSTTVHISIKHNSQSEKTAVIEVVPTSFNLKNNELLTITIFCTPLICGKIQQLLKIEWNKYCINLTIHAFGFDRKMQSLSIEENVESNANDNKMISCKKKNNKRRLSQVRREDARMNKYRKSPPIRRETVITLAPYSSPLTNIANVYKNDGKYEFFSAQINEEEDEDIDLFIKTPKILKRRKMNCKTLRKKLEEKEIRKSLILVKFRMRTKYDHKQYLKNRSNVSRIQAGCKAYYLQKKCKQKIENERNEKKAMEMIEEEKQQRFLKKKMEQELKLKVNQININRMMNEENERNRKEFERYLYLIFKYIHK